MTYKTREELAAFRAPCNLPRPSRAEMKNYIAIFNTRLEHRKTYKNLRKERAGNTCTAPLTSKYAGNYCDGSCNWELFVRSDLVGYLTTNHVERERKVGIKKNICLCRLHFSCEIIIIIIKKKKRKKRTEFTSSYF